MPSPSQTPGEPAELNALVGLAQREHRAGRLAEAAAMYQRVIALRPDVAEMHYNLGVLLCQLGQFDQALPRFEQALALKPNLVDAHHGLGRLFDQSGDYQRAAAHYECALALRPELAEACNRLGLILAQQGQFDQAAARLEQAIAAAPNYAEAYNNLASVLFRQDKLDQAEARIRQALALQSDFSEAHNNLGNTLAAQSKFAEAVASFERAIALAPNSPEAYNNLGNTLRQQGQFEQGMTRFRQALALRPDFAEVHFNLGYYFWELGKIDEAAASFEQALALRPNYAEAQWGLATCVLVQGDYQRGWPMYEGRLAIPGFAPRHSLPRWTGEPLAGRSICLLAEQGLGDTLQFLRYARLLKERGAHVVLATPGALGPLLASHPDLDELFILGSAENLPRCDFCLPLLSLPGLFGTTVETIPSRVPYLSADPALTDKWRGELAAIAGFRIGMVWQGSRRNPSDFLRSIPLACFAPLANLPGVRLISLQRGFGAQQIKEVDFPVIDFGDRLDQTAGPFMDTAAVISNLDLVIAPDSAIVHLAGALGASVFLALQLAADWRWQRDRSDSPWYPNMRLFRQTAFAQWEGVFERMAQAIRERRSERA